MHHVCNCIAQCLLVALHTGYGRVGATDGGNDSQQEVSSGASTCVGLDLCVALPRRLAQLSKYAPLSRTAKLHVLSGYTCAAMSG
jgi:hypothetical protein